MFLMILDETFLSWSKSINKLEIKYNSSFQSYFWYSLNCLFSNSDFINFSYIFISFVININFNLNIDLIYKNKKILYLIKYSTFFIR